MKTHKVVLLVIAALTLSLLAGCNITIGGPPPQPTAAQSIPPSEPRPGELPPGEPRPGEIPPGEPRPGGMPPNEPRPGEMPPNEPRPGEIQPDPLPPNQPPQPPQSSSAGGCPGAPVIPSFAASKTNITAGESVTLSWGNVTNGNSGQLVRSVTITPGLGEVGSGASTRSVKPVQTTTYTLTATGCGGTATKSLTISVSQAPAAVATATPILAQMIRMDLAVTDLYADAQWKVYLKIKNNGPDGGNMVFSYSCSQTFTPAGGGGQGTGTLPPQSVTTTLNANQEKSFDTGMILSKTGWYEVSCSITMFGDPNNSNNSQTKKITRGP